MKHACTMMMMLMTADALLLLQRRSRALSLEFGRKGKGVVDEKLLDEVVRADEVEEEIEELFFETASTAVVEKETRLDAALVSAFPETARGRWGKAVEEGKVRVNGELEKKKSLPVFIGDVLEAASLGEPEYERVVAEDLPLEILFEDDDIIVVNKAPGMVTHPAPGHRTGTLVNAIAHHCRAVAYLGSDDALDLPDARPGIVHRLDKGTSGSMVVAKTPEAHAKLSEAFALRTVSKPYLAVVAGVLGTEDELVIDEPIARHPIRRQEMAVNPEGKRALSRVRVLSADSKRSVLEVTIETGRTHQIRVHLAHVGAPVLGDDVYGDDNSNRLAMKTAIKPTRPMLHAWRLGFAHPRTGEPLLFTSKLPSDFERALKIVSGR